MFLDAIVLVACVGLTAAVLSRAYHAHLRHLADREISRAGARTGAVQPPPYPFSARF
jgi:hypothetical protein